MSAHILSIGTAVPPFSHSQEAIGKAMDSRLHLEEGKRKKLQKIYKYSSIRTRHVAFDRFLDEEGERFFSLEARPKIGERNVLYKKYALPLALRAAEQALDVSGVEREKITHVISVSCTGVFAPGLEFSLIEQLGLNRHVERFGINFMGCFGAFRALAAASALAKEDPSHLILIVCTELCSLHFQPDTSWDALIANALFSDGAAAAIIGNQYDRSVFEIVRKKAFSIPNSFDAMQWEAKDEGLCMRLSEKVPSHIKGEIRGFVNGLLSGISSIEECDWPIHPGGKAILLQLEQELMLERKQTAPSWDVLSAYGNMSSATFLFVLSELMKRPANERAPFAVGLGFGPGLSLEGIVLRNSGSELCELSE